MVCPKCGASLPIEGGSLVASGVARPAFPLDVVLTLHSECYCSACHLSVKWSERRLYQLVELK